MNRLGLIVAVLMIVGVSAFSIGAAFGIDILQKSVDMRLLAGERHSLSFKTSYFTETDNLEDLWNTDISFSLLYHFNFLRLFRFLDVGTDVGGILKILDTSKNKSYDYFLNLGLSIDYPLTKKFHIYFNAPFFGVHRVVSNFYDPYTLWQITSYPWELSLQVRI